MALVKQPTTEPIPRRWRQMFKDLPLDPWGSPYGYKYPGKHNPKEFDPRKYLGPARTKVKELVRHKVKDVLCCAGHAFD